MGNLVVEQIPIIINRHVLGLIRAITLVHLTIIVGIIRL